MYASFYITDDSAIGVSWDRQKKNTEVVIFNFPAT